MGLEATTKNYWIAPNAISISLNALGDENRIQGSIVSGSIISCYIESVKPESAGEQYAGNGDGLGLDNGRNPKRWSLVISPTFFNSDTLKYVYAAIPRKASFSTLAVVVFPSEKIDLYGKNDNDEQIGSMDYFYVWLQGIISAPTGSPLHREWTQDMVWGSLGTYEDIVDMSESDWYSYSKTTDTVSFLKRILMNAGSFFQNIFLGGANNELTGVATAATPSQYINSDTLVATPNFIKQHYLRKDVDDEANGQITFKQKSIHEYGAQFGSSFASGLAGHGGKIDGLGQGELESLTLRRFLEVPELRYNRVSIYVGNQWRAPGGGIIESVTPDEDEQGNILTTGTITLHLEDGEIGTIAVDDICQGIFHDGITPANNDAESYDDGIGNFKFGGFFTSYFRVTEILDNAKNSRFRYALRPTNNLPRPTGEAGRTAGGSWTQSHHPCEAMHFVAYGNFTNTDRQSSRYSTLTYERFLMGVNWWEFNENNVGAQFGDLSNLSVFGLDMTGYSAYLNNIYMSGTIQQFENLPPRMEIDTQGDSFLAMGESMLVTCTVMRGWDDVTSQVTQWEVVRDSGDAADDAAWLYREKVIDFYRGNPRPAQEEGEEEYLNPGQLVLCHDTNPTIDDLGNNTNVLSTLFTFKAYLADGSNSQFQLEI
jgi:hypothetical protein